MDLVEKFDRPDIGFEARDAIAHVVRAAVNRNSDEAARILLITGQAGAGKTHLVVREFNKYSHPAQCVLIYRPEAMRDFGEWLDRQLVTHLLRNEASNPRLNHALQEIAFDAMVRAFPGKRPKVSETQNVLTRAADQHFAGRIVKVLLEPFSNRRKLKSLAEELAMKIGIAGDVGANDFCAALMMLASGPMSTEAVQVFTARKAPQSLQQYLSDDLIARWNLRHLLASTLKYIDGALVLFFDQLESLAVADDAQPHALRGLLSSCTALIQNESNVACIVAALQEVANDAVPRLPGPDQQRIRLPPAPQDLELVRRARVLDFLGPRLEYLETKSDRATVEPLRGFAAWIQEDTELNQLAPRFVISLLDTYSRLVAYRGRAASAIATYREAWDATVEQFDQAHQSELALSPTGDVEAAWIRLQAEFDPADATIGNAIDAMGLLDWALDVVAPVAFGVTRAKVLLPEVRNGIASADLNVDFKNQRREARTIFILDQKNYRRELLNALTRVVDTDNRITKIVIRFREKFPTAGSSSLLPLLNRIKAGGGIVADFLEPEMLLLGQLRLLQSEVDSEDYVEWLRSKVMPLATVKACVRPR